MMRCCKDTFRWKLKDRTPVEGEQLICRWGGEVWRFEKGEWKEQPPWTPESVEARAVRADEILKGK